MVKRKSYTVVFNGNDLASATGAFIYYYDATDLPKRDIKINKLARRSLSIITSSEYTDKTVRINALVCAGKRADTEKAITQLKGLLLRQNGSLEVKESGDTYVYTATMNEFNIKWDANTADCEIVMLASTPVATSKYTSNLFNFTTSAANDGSTFSVEGSFYAEPFITVTMTAVSGATNQSFSVFNAMNNQGITITGSFVNGDIIEIDCSEYAVRKNGTNIDFTGLFPTFGVGQQRVGYSDTFSSRTVTLTGDYNKRIV